MTLSSSTIATRLPAAGLAHASPTSCLHPPLPEPLNWTPTTHSPSPCCSVSAVAFLTPVPSRRALPMTTGAPLSSLRTCSPFAAFSLAAGTRSTSWNDSCAVWPMTFAASRGSCTPGSSTMMRVSPERARVGSATPSASTRPRSTPRARSVDSALALARSESLACRTIWVPPLRSRPRLAVLVRAKIREMATTANAATARHSGARDMGQLSRDTRKRGKDGWMARAQRAGGARPVGVTRSLPVRTTRVAGVATAAAGRGSGVAVGGVETRSRCCGAC